MLTGPASAPLVVAETRARGVSSSAISTSLMGFSIGTPARETPLTVTLKVSVPSKRASSRTGIVKVAVSLPSGIERTALPKTESS